MSNLVETKNTSSSFTNQNWYRILKGVALSFILTLIFLLLFSIILTYSNLSEITMAPVIIVITAVSILAGSCLSTRKITKNGLLNGGIVGLVYMLAIYFLSSAVTGVYSLNLSSIILFIVGSLAGAVGGIIGVNLK